MEDPDRAVLRRRNVLAVQPILRALRTSSLGNWMAALAREEYARAYTEHLVHLWSALPSMAHLNAERGQYANADEEESRPRHVALVLIGTERGLCGRFNATLAEYAEDHLADLIAEGCTVELIALGTRVIRLLRSHKRSVREAIGLPSSLPSLEMAHALTRAWIERYEQHSLDVVEVVYCEHLRAGLYSPSIRRVIPPTLPSTHAGEEVWPPYEVETDVFSLHARMVEQWTALSFYGLLLRSAIADNAARSQLMDSATQNAQRVLDELLQSIQLARQHATTSEMQELAAGAGLLAKRRVRRVTREERSTPE